MKVAIVILNYNSEADTIKYVESIKEYKNLNKIIITATQNGILKKVVNNEKIDTEFQNNMNEKEDQNKDEENKED